MRADDSVAQSIAEIRKYYALGSSVPGRKYGKMPSAAEKLDLNIDYMRACRRLAQLYTPRQFDQLCFACQAGGYPIGWARTMLLLRVPTAEARKALLNEAIQENWSKSEMIAEIRRRFGIRSKPGAGRPTKLDTAGSPKAIYNKALEVCMKFDSFMTAARREAERGVTPLDQIPPSTRACIERAESAMKALRRAITPRVIGDSKPT